MFRLRAFGGLTLERDGAPYAGPATQRRRLALLGILAAAADQGMSRERLTAYLWPDADPERARHSLDTALSALRRELGGDELFVGVATLRLNSGVLPSDLAEYAAALAAGDHERAAALYGGPYLDGFAIPDAGEFDRWVDGERRRRGLAHQQVIERLATDAERRDDYTAAVQWWRMRVELDPIDTAAARRLMNVLAASGNAAEALRVARVHEALVQEEVGSGPGPEWRSAVERIRADMEQPPTRRTPERPAPPAPPPADNAPAGNPTALTAPTTRNERRRGLPALPALLAATGLLMLLALGAWAVLRAGPAHDGPVTVAVLPFASTSGDAADEPFSDGLTDELITALSSVEGLAVTGRTSAFALKGKGLSVRAVADTLGAAHVLEGSVRREGSRLRINAQLVSADDNAVLWSDTYDREMADVFAVQEEIARAIVAALAPTLDAAGVPAGRPPRDLMAYELFLRGRYFMARRTPDDLRRAVGYFEEAIARDSAYARAHAGLAEAHLLIAIFGSHASGERLPLVHAAAQSAIRLDPRLPEAHAVIGTLHEAFYWDRETAERELARARALDPGYAPARLYLGILRLHQGRFEDATAELEAARRLDPLAAPVHFQLGRGYMLARRPEAAIGPLNAAVELAPGLALGHQHLGDAYLQLARPAEALAAFRRAAELGGVRDSAHLAYALSVTGHREEAERMLAPILRSGADRYLPPVPLAMAYTGLGDADAAFEWLERGRTDRAMFMNSIEVTPAFEPLRSDRRWEELLRRMASAGADRS